MSAANAVPDAELAAGLLATVGEQRRALVLLDELVGRLRGDVVVLERLVEELAKKVDALETRARGRS